MITRLAIALLIVFPSHAEATNYKYRPDRNLTPGHVAGNAFEDVCSSGYPERSRNVTFSTKKRVFDTYKTPIKDRAGDVSKIDHLVPLSIGGSNDVRNLWPHYYKGHPVWTVYKKSRLEVKLRKMVCNEKYDIIKAQLCVSSSWVGCYRKIFNVDKNGKLNGSLTNKQ